MRRVAIGALSALLLAGLLLALAGGRGWLGRPYPPGEVTRAAAPERVIAARERAQSEARRASGAAEDASQILFGDLHVHTTYSADAFLMSLPAAGGEGAHPVADACDFARYCAALDFWSINDHAFSLTPARWEQTVASIRQCNAVAADPRRPDTLAFLGWEWTQIGATPDTHYGHKNVVLRDLHEDDIPARPIAAPAPAAAPGTLELALLVATQRSRQALDTARYFRDTAAPPFCPPGVPVRELPRDCREVAATPGELFAKLDDWGHTALVIPHGTTWGFYTPPGSTWDKQLSPAEHDPARQRLIEVYSGHGNAEEYRPWRALETGEAGAPRCPEPTSGYLPSCWHAGEIVRARCAAAGEGAAVCEERAAEARRFYAEAGVPGHLTVPGARPADWLDAGQCQDCWLPTFNHRPGGSVQYITALRAFEPGDGPRRFRFGFLASSDNHSARPGTGYKEYARSATTEAGFGDLARGLVGASEPEVPQPRARRYDPAAGNFFTRQETERQASYFLTGGLVAAHAQGRDRGAVWDALQRREVYGTSGPRILLWFDLVNAPGGAPQPMGASVRLREAPRFEVRAAGSFEQRPGCPDWAEAALAPERLARLCRGECYHPSEQRRPITRIEVVRIRPQQHPGEAVERLVEDPWRVLPCPGDGGGCRVAFEDPDFAAGARDAVYYVRAIEAPSPAVNGGLERCERDEAGRCLRADLCLGGPADDDCLAPVEERAWSSPIFVDYDAS